MKNIERKLLLLMPIFMVIFLLGVIFLSIKIIFNEKLEQPIKKEIIIQKWINNEKQFNKSANELIKNKKNIFIERENDGYIRIKQREETTQSNIETVPKNQLNDYKQTIYLMEQLNINKIQKSNEGIIFEININTHSSQIIMYAENISQVQFYNSYCTVENIKNKWYYMEERIIPEY